MRRLPRHRLLRQRGRLKSCEPSRSLPRIKTGETTPDKQLSLLTARCIGACGIAPVVVYDGAPAGRLAPEQAIEKLKGFLHVN